MSERRNIDVRENTMFNHWIWELQKIDSGVENVLMLMIWFCCYLLCLSTGMDSFLVIEETWWFLVSKGDIGVGSSWIFWLVWSLKRTDCCNLMKEIKKSGLWYIQLHLKSLSLTEWFSGGLWWFMRSLEPSMSSFVPKWVSQWWRREISEFLVYI